MRALTKNIESCIRNAYQGEYRRVVTVCSGGCLRSPTAAVVLAGDPWNYNTRSAGLSDDFAINQFDDVLFNWADEIVVMDVGMFHEIRKRYPDDDKPIVVLGIKDNYSYRDPELIELIIKKYTELHTPKIKRLISMYSPETIIV